ncbi:DUF1549 domain-containing protein [Lignipirellula cremea]|uniref:Bacterial Ig-like domain (Group 2) n=1 Tax=Lignipirellula cremea TaxID=2528010 RepID=A0A518E2C2_9BACT|nr:DUF1549 domain-containing protein [Lignipirellula cremea]QDU98202.1 Bacterial Ig-like domain (group 2) [Lignipirellula cremea]
MTRFILWAALLLPGVVPGGSAFAVELERPLRVEPGRITLTNSRYPHSILVTGQSPDGRSLDLTSQAVFRSSDEKIARVDLLGWVEAVGPGTAQITVEAAGQTAQVTVVSQTDAAPQPYSFRRDVMSVLSKSGCNMGACHGYSLGKNGFKLSLRGSDPDQDFAALTQEFFSRRVNRHQPAASLLLLKPLGEVPHEGGVRFEQGGLLHRQLLGWIEEGAVGDIEDPVRVESVRIFPEHAVVSPGQQHQLQVIARYSDGSERDVSRLAVYTVNREDIATVDEEGLVVATTLGETAVSARFERIFATSNFIMLDPNPDFQPTPVPGGNLIDRLVVEKLNSLNIRPSERASDEVFLRRVQLDLIGVQPTPAEVRAFVADQGPNKREQLVDALFARPEFVDQWSLKWGDLLQVSRTHLSEPSVFAMREWIRMAIAANMPLDEFAQKVLASKGSYLDDPASGYYQVSKDADDTLQRATQVFCGVRMLCAKCHPHPFENWTQEDYYGLHSFFNQTTFKADPRQPGVKNARTVLLNLGAGHSRNPRSGKNQPPRFLGGAEPEIAAGADRREVYAAWLTSPENPFFARSLANRIWSYFFHRGIIHPVDDIRTTNPPINPQLLDALAEEFIRSGFDARRLMRLIVLSDTYQRSSVANATNAHDELNFSRMIPRRLPAESLLDSLAQATGVPERFSGAPAGFTATQLPDANVGSDFLELFGKPMRMEACECERDEGSNMLQALHLINGKAILSRVTAANARPALLLREARTDAALVEELYLWCLARQPTAEEQEVAAGYLASQAESRAEAVQDLMWALFNSRDFMLVY